MIEFLIILILRTLYLYCHLYCREANKFYSPDWTNEGDDYPLIYLSCLNNHPREGCRKALTSVTILLTLLLLCSSLYFSDSSPSFYTFCKNPTSLTSSYFFINYLYSSNFLRSSSILSWKNSLIGGL